MRFPLVLGQLLSAPVELEAAAVARATRLARTCGCGPACRAASLARTHRELPASLRSHVGERRSARCSLATGLCCASHASPRICRAVRAAAEVIRSVGAAVIRPVGRCVEVGGCAEVRGRVALAARLSDASRPHPRPPPRARCPGTSSPPRGPPPPPARVPRRPPPALPHPGPGPAIGPYPAGQAPGTHREGREAALPRPAPPRAALPRPRPVRRSGPPASAVDRRGPVSGSPRRARALRGGPGRGLRPQRLFFWGGGMKDVGGRGEGASLI